MFNTSAIEFGSSENQVGSRGLGTFLGRVAYPYLGFAIDSYRLPDDLLIDRSNAPAIPGSSETPDYYVLQVAHDPNLEKEATEDENNPDFGARDNAKALYQLAENLGVGTGELNRLRISIVERQFFEPSFATQSLPEFAYKNTWTETRQQPVRTTFGGWVNGPDPSTTYKPKTAQIAKVTSYVVVPPHTSGEPEFRSISSDRGEVGFSFPLPQRSE